MREANRNSRPVYSCFSRPHLQRAVPVFPRQRTVKVAILNRDFSSLFPGTVNRVTTTEQERKAMNYIAKLEEMGLTDTQIATILSGWSSESIEALLRGEKEPPSQESLLAAILACGAD